MVGFVINCQTFIHVQLLANGVQLALTTFNLKQDIVMRDECFEVVSIFFRHR